MTVNRTMNVIVTNYDKNWPELFEVEASKLRDIFKDEIVDIHHIGSTSVNNLKAKPIIDMMPVVKDIEKVDLFNTEMIKIGYEPLGEFGLEGRRYFRKGGENRTHQIHMYQYDNSGQIDRHLAVRDYLRAHPEEAFEYGELKEKLAHQYPKDIEGYMDGKYAFVKNLERKAIEWKNHISRT